MVSRSLVSCLPFASPPLPNLVALWVRQAGGHNKHLEGVLGPLRIGPVSPGKKPSGEASNLNKKCKQ